MADPTKDKDKKGVKMPDVDAIDSLSLSMIPLQSNTLKGARLVKNSRMETAVELHSDPISGSLQIMPEDIADAFAGAERDQQIISQLASLNSYDVYSLRSSLKKIGVQIDEDTLSLSDNMKETLAAYTLEFTRPLIEQIFGAGGSVDATAPGGLQKIFRDPDIARVRDNLKTMTQKTGIPLEEIPSFLEKYSDVFLSVAYYRYSLQSVQKDLERFLKWIKALQETREVTSNPRTLNSCKKVEDTMKFITASITDRLNRFQKGFEQFWGNISKESFEQLKKQVEENHASMGAVLCGLLVKVRAWAKDFPDDNVGSGAKRAQFVTTELEPGLEKIKILETDARKRLGL